MLTNAQNGVLFLKIVPEFCFFTSHARTGIYFGFRPLDFLPATGGTPGHGGLRL